MASPAVKVTFGVLGGVLGLVILLVVALLAWGVFRPLLAGDYGHTNGFVNTINDLNLMPLAAMVSTVGLGAPAENAEQYENRITNTIGQIATLTDEVDDALSSRAGSKDEELNGLLTDLNGAYAEMSDTFLAWEADGYAVAANAAVLCAGNDLSACAAAATEARDAGASDPMLAALVAGAETVAGGGSTAELDEARATFTEHTIDLWSAVEERTAAVSDYLRATGHLDE